MHHGGPFLAEILLDGKNARIPVVVGIVDARKMMPVPLKIRVFALPAGKVKMGGPLYFVAFGQLFVAVVGIDLPRPKLFRSVRPGLVI